MTFASTVFFFFSSRRRHRRFDCDWSSAVCSSDLARRAAALIKSLGRGLPRTGRDPAAAAALLQDLADRALASDFEPVACLEAPEPAEVPASLRRADGRSVYQRHGGTRDAKIGRAPAELQSQSNLVCRLLLENKKT